MEVSSRGNIINIDGNIKSILDFQTIKNNIDTIIPQYKNIIVNINDSISITSSVIGYFNKLILKDNINLQINVSSKQLIELFDDLNLTSTFHVKSI
ncbi:hypothetical protein KKG77_02475 [bacterium]|nr:hypothetical protein [bacterium]